MIPSPERIREIISQLKIEPEDEWTPEQRALVKELPVEPMCAGNLEHWAIVIEKAKIAMRVLRALDHFILDDRYKTRINDVHRALGNNFDEIFNILDSMTISQAPPPPDLSEYGKKANPWKKETSNADH